MVNSIDYREIVQTVTINVLTDVKSQLVSMQPGIVDRIIKSVKSSFQPELDSLASQLGDLEWRVSQLEQKSDSVLAKPMQILFSHINGAANVSSVSTENDTQKRSLLNSIDGWLHIVYKGWIIYHNEEDRHTYMIRKNGSDIKDISKFFNKKPYIFCKVVEFGSDWFIRYKDRAIDLHSAVIPKP